MAVAVVVVVAKLGTASREDSGGRSTGIIYYQLDNDDNANDDDYFT